MTPALNPCVLRKLRQEDHFEFEASLDDIMTSRLACITVLDPVSSKTHQNLNIRHFESLSESCWLSRGLQTDAMRKTDTHEYLYDAPGNMYVWGHCMTCITQCSL